MKQLKLLLSLLMLCWASSALAHDFEVNGIYYKKNGTEATVTYRGTSSSQYPDEYTGSVTIPSTVTYNGTTYPVTAIDMGAFSYCTNLTNMTIGPSVKVIGIAAFKDCTGMTSLIISNSVTTINLSAFSGCSGLTSVTFPNSVTTIGSMVFAECTGLTSLTIPNSVSSIDPLAFYGCSSIASIKVNSGNSTYDSRNNCNAIIETASNTLAIGCKNTTIPNTVTTIGNSAFYGCTNLTSVTIPNSVTTISKFAFYQCSGLKSFTIPNSVTTIGNRAFYDCTGLTSVICQATTPPTMENSSVFSNYSTPTLYVPAESLQAYQTTDYWNMFTNILTTDELDENRFVVNGIYYQIIDSEVIVTYRGKSWSQYSNEYSGAVTIPSTVTHNGTTYPVTAIGDYAFRNCTTLTSVTIPNSVTSIGEYAFGRCNGLTDLSIPNSVITISKDAFTECSGLTSLTIPNSVRTIGQSAFSYCEGLTSLTLGDSVTSIEQAAFYGCSGLTSVTIPSSVTTIGQSVFSECTNLMNIEVESGNSIFDSRNNCNAIIETASNTLFVGCKNTIIPNSVTTIGKNAFFCCWGLTSVTIPNSVTTIGNGAFSGCSYLTSVTIPNSVIIIDNSAFSGCSYLTSVTIPNSVTTIGGNAFLGCNALTSVTIPNSVISIGYSAFSGCNSLTSIEVESGNSIYDSRNNCNAIIETASNTLFAGCKNTIIPNTVTSIGVRAFYICTGLTSITIPNSITSIGDWAFSHCRGLTSITIPNSVISISPLAFGSCSNLTSLVIGNSVTSIGNSAFASCQNLTSVICKAATPPTMESSIVFSNYSKPKLYVPEESLEAYQTTDYWNMFTNILSMEHLQDDKFEVNGIYYYIIGDEAIVTYKSTSYSQYNNEYSGSVTIPSTVTHNGLSYPVTTIGESAFLNCTALTSVTIPNSVTSIDKEAFRNCTALTSVTIPNSVTSIDKEAFSNCSGLTGELIIPSSITDLGMAVFKNCSGLTSVTIPNSITRISDELFWDCTGLTNVNLPNTITCIGEVAFEGCTSLTSFTIPNTVDSILYSAFKNCTGLKRLDIPNSVFLIDDEAFWNCTSLESLTIGCSVVTIRPQAFGSCPNLTRIVVSTDNPVFDSRDNCNGIIETANNKLNTGCKSTIIPNTVTTIGQSAFEGINSMTSVTIPASITHIETDAFSDCRSLTSVICKAVTPPCMDDIHIFWWYNNYNNNNSYTTATLYVPAASLQAYRNTDYWNRFTNILPIEDYATDMPTITTELSIGAMTVTASGNGTVALMVDGVVVENPYDIPRTEQTQVMTVTATAQEEGKLISDIASLEVTIPAILPLNTDNYLSMSDAATVRGATLRIPVRMTNAATIVSFQTDIELDEGLEVIQVDGDYLIEPSDRMTRTHSISSNRLANGNIRVLCYSTNYKAFTGNSGDELFYITVRGTAAAEGDYTITLKNTLFTDRDFDELRAPDASAIVNVQPYLLGDANGSGTVTVTDVVVTAQRVLEYDPQPFVFEGADVNEDGIISVTDVTRIAYMVLNSLTIHAPMRAPVMWNNGDCLSAADISLAAGETRTVAIRLDNALDYTALQFDLTLPDGLTAANFRLTERATGLSLDVNDVGNGTTRVLCYSTALVPISGHECVLLTFDVTATGVVRGDITVDGTELVTTGCQTVMLDGFTIGVNGSTGVNEMAAGKTVARVDYFNLAGQQIDCPESGVSIVVTTYTDGTSSTSKIIK